MLLIAGNGLLLAFIYAYTVRQGQASFVQELARFAPNATPYLLGRIVEITSGESLKANIALVEHNARLGAAIATAYAG